MTRSGVGAASGSPAEGTPTGPQVLQYAANLCRLGYTEADLAAPGMLRW